MIAARPQLNCARPIILVRTESGNVMPAIKWDGGESYSMNERLENRVFGRIKGAALKEAFRIVRGNGGLDISGEYGSIEVANDGSEFEADSGLQDDMNRKYESVTCEGDLKNKGRLKARLGPAKDNHQIRDIS